MARSRMRGAAGDSGPGLRLRSIRATGPPRAVIAEFSESGESNCGEPSRKKAPHEAELPCSVAASISGRRTATAAGSRGSARPASTTTIHVPCRPPHIALSRSERTRRRLVPRKSPTSGRYWASRPTAPAAASARPSAAARSSADRASGRRPCCRRAADG